MLKIFNIWQKAGPPLAVIVQKTPAPDRGDAVAVIRTHSLSRFPLRD
jgi:hypothetical protein